MDAFVTAIHSHALTPATRHRASSTQAVACCWKRTRAASTGSWTAAEVRASIIEIAPVLTAMSSTSRSNACAWTFDKRQLAVR